MRNEVINRISRLLPLYSIESSEGRRQDATGQQVGRYGQGCGKGTDNSAGLTSSEIPELALLALGSEGPRLERPSEQGCGRRLSLLSTKQDVEGEEELQLAF